MKLLSSSSACSRSLCRAVPEQPRVCAPCSCQSSPHPALPTAVCTAGQAQCSFCLSLIQAWICSLSSGTGSSMFSVSV